MGIAFGAVQVRNKKKKNFISTLLATHDMDVTFGWAERVVGMEEGRVRLDGSSKEVQAVFESENPAFAGHVPPRL